jgi:hypothetical protein
MPKPLLIISVLIFGAIFTGVAMGETDYASYCTDYADYFIKTAKGNESIAFRDKLDSKKLDYSFESLKVIDAYLEYLYKNRSKIGEHEEINTIVWGGCYIGEVIKRNSEKVFHWENYNTYIERNPKLKEIISYGPGTMVFLVDDRGAMTMPLNKVGRFIYEGPENNIHFYASGELNYRK